MESTADMTSSATLLLARAAFVVANWPALTLRMHKGAATGSRAFKTISATVLAVRNLTPQRAFAAL